MALQFGPVDARASLLCFDLDGPLLDLSERYWRVHASAAGLDLAAARGRARYLALKRGGLSDGEICRRLGVSRTASAYSARRRVLLEQADYLALDRVWRWTARVLTTLHRTYRIAIVTRRHDAHTYRGQLLATGLRRLVDVEVCAGDVDGCADVDKSALIRRAERRCAATAVALVGDTELDIETARSMGLIAIAVSCGLRDRRQLSRARPDVLLDDIRPLLPLLRRR